MAYITLARPGGFIRVKELKELLKDIPDNCPVRIDGIGRTAPIVEIRLGQDNEIEVFVIEIH